MDLAALAAELTAGHPVTGAYDADAATAAAQINAVNIVRIRATMTGSEMFLNTDPAEWGGLTDQKKLEWLNFCGIDSHDPANNGVAHKFVEYIFGATSATETALGAARDETISRAAELGLGRVRAGDIEAARA